jgi:hypothetical protein
MNFNRIISEVSGANTNTTPENYLSRKVSQFKSGMITSIIITVVSVIIILSVFLYIGFMAMKNL